MATVTLRNVSKAFGSVSVLNNINLEIKDREFVVFVGPSGCGKTTLLRLIAGLEDSCEGEIFIGNQLVNHVPPAKRKLAMVFQSYALYPHMTVYDNMGFGLKVSRYSREDIRERVLNAARILRIENLLERKPKQLSGGQRQRVAIGRAIVREPHVFLFDEPLSNLDTSLRVQMRAELAALKAQLKTTMIYVTHDQTEAMTLADRIVVLHDGRIEQIGHPLELYHNPCNQFVASFIGSPQMNFLSTQVLSVVNNALTLELFPGISLPFSGLKVGEKVTLGVRPEHIQIAYEDKISPFLRLNGKIQRLEHLGSESHCYVTVADQSTIVVKSANAESLAAGQDIILTLPLSYCHLFDEAGKTLIPHSQNQDTIFRKKSL